MSDFCHRCQAELPGGSGADAVLFCPHCSAPQLRLPEHMRAVGDAAPLTTGALPPPRVDAQAIDWRAAVRAGAVVAVVAAVVAVAQLKVETLGLFSMLWMLGSGVMAMQLYRRQSPRARISAKTGWRIGLVMGLMMVAAEGSSMAVAGVAARYQLHAMGKFDDDNVKMQKTMSGFMGLDKQDKSVQDRYAEMMGSPELRAGWSLAGIGFQAGFMVLIAGGAGRWRVLARAQDWAERAAGTLIV